MGIFVAERKFLGEIGVLDEGMKVYGGENVELGIRVSKPTYLIPCSKHDDTISGQQQESRDLLGSRYPPTLHFVCLTFT